jgi:hypothetical protein
MLLRDRLGYKGELRAIGTVLLDQVPLMLRTGFDSFEVDHAPTIARLVEKRLPGIDLHYQPSADRTADHDRLQLAPHRHPERLNGGAKPCISTSPTRPASATRSKRSKASG